jgi:hypothetical protein
MYIVKIQMDIFKYIPIIVGVRAKDFITVISTKKVVDTLENVHKRLLVKLRKQGYSCALVFQNELYLLRNLQDLNNNEIKTFISTVPNWDVLIMSSLTSSFIDVPGFEFIKKLENNTDFFSNEIYIVSERFMQKIEDEALWNINTYIYTKPFLQDLDSRYSHSNVNEYTIGRITNINHMSAGELKYQWVDYGI